jgi:ElaB/YqjD/DUF883 family membrane-anchored ribosome-binding protein
MNTEARTMETNGARYGANGGSDAAEELREIVEKAEALLGTLTGEGGEALDELRARVTETVRSARERLREIDSLARDATQRAADTADAYVTGNPWTAVAVAAAVGAVAGAALARRI